MIVAVVGGSAEEIEHFRCVIVGIEHDGFFSISAQDSDIADLFTTVPAPALVFRLSGRDLEVFKWAGTGQQICPVCLETRALVRSGPDRDEDASLSPNHHSTYKPLSGFAREVVAQLGSVCAAACEPIGYKVDLVKIRWSPLAVEPDSNCRLCHPAQKDSPATLMLRSRPKLSRSQYRLSDAADFSFATAPYINANTGMLAAEYSPSRQHPFCAQVRGSFRAGRKRRHSVTWSGSTSSYKSSLGIGICEALERYSALKLRGRRIAAFDSYLNLADRALDPKTCGLYEQHTYASSLNLRPFDLDSKVRWVWGYSLTEQRPLLVPMQQVYYGLHFDDEPKFVDGNSSGCATGSCLEEAIFFALLELIERDALVLRWLARLPAPRVDLSKVQNQQLLWLMSRLDRAGLEYRLLDSRLDLAVPSFIAIVKRSKPGLGALSASGACNYDPEKGMLSALSEASNYHVGFPERTKIAEKRLRAAWADFTLVRALSDHPAVYGLPEAASEAEFLVQAGESHSAAGLYGAWLDSLPDGNDLLYDVQHCLAQLARVQLKQVVIVDITSPEAARAGLQTVRAIVPGLMPIDFGYGKCRAASLPRFHSIRSSFQPQGGLAARPLINRTPHPFP